MQGFKRVFLKAGETQTVDFELKPSQMAGRDIDNIAVLKEGNILVAVGGKQPDETALLQKKAVQKTIQLKGDKLYINE